MRTLTQSKAFITASLILLLLFSSLRIQGYFQQSTGKIVFEGNLVRLVEWSPQSDLIAIDLIGKSKLTILDSTTGDTIDLWNNALINPSPSGPSVVAWSPDGKTLASLEGNSTVRLWDLETRENVSYINIKEETGDWGNLEKGSLAWSPDGNRIAIADGASNLHIWNSVTSEFLVIPTMFPPFGGARGVAWSPDGSKIAVVDESSRIEIFDTDTLQHISMLSKDELPIVVGPAISKHYAQYLEWSPDGQRIANYYSHDPGNFIFVRNASTGEVLAIIDDHRDLVQAIAWSPDGSKLASGSGSWYDDAQGDNTVRIWDMDTYEELYVLEGHTDYVTTVAWSPDSSQVASGSADGTIRIWDIEPPQDTSE